MKFDRLIKHNMRNNFLEKPYLRCCGENILGPFLNHFMHFICIICPSLGLWKQTADHLLLPHKILFENKKRSETSLPASFRA